MVKDLKTAVLERIAEEEVDLFDLPDNDMVVEGDEPDYKIVVSAAFLMLLGTCMVIRHFIRRTHQQRILQASPPSR